MKRPRCKSKGCRKQASIGSHYCGEHAISPERPAPVDPEDVVMKCTREEALRFAALDAEYRLKIQTVSTLELQGENARMRYEADCAKRAAEKAAALTEANTFRREYEALVRQIAEQHGLDPKQMTIDPETCLLRDLRPTQNPE